MSRVEISDTVDCLLLLVFHPDPGNPVRDIPWVVGRDLLHAGLRSSRWVGDGDVRVTGLPPTINLCGEKGTATFRLPVRLGSFLHRTYQVVPLGAEPAFYDLDAELAAILEAG